MKTIEDLKSLNDVLVGYGEEECILRIYDNKSDILLQTVVVKHPVIFIRGIQDFCKSVSLPVSDISVQLIGFVSKECNLFNIDDICEISPYVYFKKPEEEESSKDA